MKYKKLLLRSKEYLNQNPQISEVRFSKNIFLSGAEWMCNRLNELDKCNIREFDTSINFHVYGIIKYGIFLTIFIVSAFFLLKVNPLLTPLSLIIFYFFEVHFLFLFPLILDKVKSPILCSIKHTYAMGILIALFNVIPIGFFMIVGLLNRKDPFLNWHIGCLAILFWYKDEVSNRL